MDKNREFTFTTATKERV